MNKIYYLLERYIKYIDDPYYPIGPSKNDMIEDRLRKLYKQKMDHLRPEYRYTFEDWLKKPEGINIKIGLLKVTDHTKI